MFSSAIWDKLPECIFQNFEIVRVKLGQEDDLSPKSKKPKKAGGWFIAKIAWNKHEITD